MVNIHEKDRSKDRTADFNNMKQFCRNTAKLLDLGDPDFGEFTRPHDVTSANINAYLESLKQKLKPKNNDIFIFYFSGHGANDPNKNTPVFECSNRGVYPMVQLSGFLMNLGISKPKTSLLIGDCCNHFMDRGAPQTQSNPPSAVLYRSLFQTFQGRQVILFGAASAGQPSWSHRSFGSFFGTAFREEFINLTNTANRSVSWDKLAEKIAATTKKLTKDKQKPYFNRFISTDSE